MSTYGPVNTSAGASTGRLVAPQAAPAPSSSPATPANAPATKSGLAHDDVAVRASSSAASNVNSHDAINAAFDALPAGEGEKKQRDSDFAKGLHETAHVAKELAEKAQKGAQLVSKVVRKAAPAVEELTVEGGTAASAMESVMAHANHAVGVLGIAAGSLQFKTGVVEAAHGDAAQGAADITAGTLLDASGTAAVVNSVANTGKTLGLISEVAPAVANAGRLAGPLAAGAAVVSGGMELYHGVEHFDTAEGKDEALNGGLKTFGGSLVLAGTAADATGIGAVAGLPMQAVGGGILLGDALYENRGVIADAAVATGRFVGHAAAGAAHAVGNAASDAADALSDTLSRAWKALP